MRILLCPIFVVLLCAPTARSAEGPKSLLQDLRSSSAAVRARTAVRLGQLGERQAVPALIAVLGDPAKEVRRQAAKALGAIKDPQAADALVKALEDDDANVRANAAYALGEIRDSKATEPLFQTLCDPEWCVREQAAWALREIGDTKTAERLVGMLREEKADTEQILWLLEYLGDDDVAARLESLLDDTRPFVRQRALSAIVKLQGEEAFDVLVAALEDADPGLRLAAVKALAGVADDRAKGPLASLAKVEKDATVREAAAKAVQAMSIERRLAAHWSFDDGNTKQAADVSKRGNNGKILGCAAVKGKIGRALEFGKGRYVELGQPPAFQIAQQPFTVMAWVKSETPTGVVVARGGAFCGFSLYLKDGAARFGIHRTQADPTHIAAGKEPVVGRWVHLAGVVREDRIELYVDGKQAAIAETPGLIPGNCGQGMEIGFDAGNSPAEICDCFKGIIDEVKVYHAALSEKEIAEQCGVRQETEK